MTVGLSGFIEDRVDSSCYNYMIGNGEPSEPSRVAFLNCAEACEMLHKHLMNEGFTAIGIHADVDFDGVASSKIMNVFIEELGRKYMVRNYINGIREHGLRKRHIDFINNSGCNLLIVVDSASNDIDIIEELNCDVIVLDHHNVGHREYSGNTKCGRYYIVNNTIPNSDEYIPDIRMSGAEVVYEFIRQYEYMYNTGKLIENRGMYQWVGVSLYTDVIDLGSVRNQYYIGKTVDDSEIEVDLGKLLKSLGKWENRLNKSNILFKMAPILNRAIRAGQSSKVLDIILNNTYELSSVDLYREVQSHIISLYSSNANERDTYVTVEVAKGHSGYSGVIASSIKDKIRKTTAVYQVENGYAVGSIRGAMNGYNYRAEIRNMGYYAQGHNTAFGFKVPLGEIDRVLSEVTAHEGGYEEEYAVIGDAVKEVPCKHSIANMKELITSGKLWELGMYNSRASSNEAINILAYAKDLEIVADRGKYIECSIMGTPCTAFKIPSTKYIYLYIEYSNTQSMDKVYVRDCSRP